MKIVLDTQFILWILFDSGRLSKREKEIIYDENNQIICSSISLFEISLKYSIGKLVLNNITPDKIPDLLVGNGYIIKDTTHDTFSSFYKLPRDIHKDPFDRILVWESIKNGFHLMTRDKKIMEYEKWGLKLGLTYK